jgi:predicted nuclease of restriction endonuclease-like (RecB) superfamily
MEKLDIRETLFSRVVTILEEARKSTVRAVNGNMILAYWLIGREIVQELQGGQERAEYGEKVIADLSLMLQNRYKKGFSVTNLRYFRQFYQTFSDRVQIHHPSGGESPSPSEKNDTSPTIVTIPHLPGGELRNGFKPDLTWSHYRALMQVTSLEARLFYEKEAVECGWNKVQLERQIQSSYYEKFLPSEEELRLEIEKERRLIELKFAENA